MQRNYRVHRGEDVLGYVGSDERFPGEPFEPAAAFFEIESLFAKEHELVMRAADLDQMGRVDEAESVLNDEVEPIIQQILAPGVRFEALRTILCSFECLELSIFDGRACWR